VCIGGIKDIAKAKFPTITLQSTYSQRTVNIQSTYSQHTVNIQSTDLKCKVFCWFLQHFAYMGMLINDLFNINIFKTKPHPQDKM
jgi:hypothetical protein